MGAILTALQNLALRSARFTVAEANAIYNRLWLVLITPFAVCVVAFVTNLWLGNIKTLSLVLAIVLMVGALFVWAQPLNLLYVVGAGLAKRIIASSGSFVDDVNVLLKEYLSILKWILVITMPFLLFAGTIPFQENPKAVATVIAAALVMWMFTWMWPEIFTGTRGRRLIYAFAVCVIAVSLGSLIPGPTWKKWTGWDPLTAKTTSTDEAIYRLERVQRETADADRAAELERITGKVTRREALTTAEERFIAETNKMRSKKDASEKQESGSPAICKDASAAETRTCYISTSWSNWIKMSDEFQGRGMRLCADDGPIFEKQASNGTTFWRFKMKVGHTYMKYRLYPGTENCPDILP